MLSSDVMEWLVAQYARSQIYQKSRGVDFKLTFDQYVPLWSSHRLKKLRKLLGTGALARFQRNKSFGWVLSWSTKKARSTGVMDISNARILTRLESEKRFRIQAGEKQSEAAKLKIGAAHKGKVISAKHREAISRARRGRPQSSEQIAARVAATKNTKARKADGPNVEKVAQHSVNPMPRLPDVSTRDGAGMVKATAPD